MVYHPQVREAGKRLRIRYRAGYKQDSLEVKKKLPPVPFRVRGVVFFYFSKSCECFSVFCLCDGLPEDFIEVSCCVNIVNINTLDDEKVVNLIFFVDCGVHVCSVLVVSCVDDSFRIFLENLQAVATFSHAIASPPRPPSPQGQSPCPSQTVWQGLSIRIDSVTAGAGGRACNTPTFLKFPLDSSFIFW